MSLTRPVIAGLQCDRPVLGKPDNCRARCTSVASLHNVGCTGASHSNRCSPAVRRTGRRPAPVSGVRPCTSSDNISDTTDTSDAAHVSTSSDAAPVVRRMILLRHADSESSSRLRDYERPISIQGKRQALKIADKLKKLGWTPDLILASNSKRTRQTLEQMTEACSELSTVNAHFLGSLYTVSALDGQTQSHLQECILNMASDAENLCVMCIGHNKGWEEAATAYAQQAVRLQTASAALFEAGGRTWEECFAEDVSWRLVDVVAP